LHFFDNELILQRQHYTESLENTGVGWKLWSLCLGSSRARDRCDRLVLKCNDGKSGYGITDITKVERLRVTLYPTMKEVRLQVSADFEDAASLTRSGRTDFPTRRHVSSRTYLLRRAVVNAVVRRRQRRASRRPTPPHLLCEMRHGHHHALEFQRGGWMDSLILWLRHDAASATEVTRNTINVGRRC
jgi:hypothetical protein